MSKRDIESGLLHVYETVYSREAHLKRSRKMIDIFKKLTQARGEISGIKEH